MTIKIILIAFILISSIAITFCTGNNNNNTTTVDISNSEMNILTGVKKNEVALKEYETALSKWKKANIKKYTMTLNYGAFSPLAGTWDITVENGVVKDILFNKEACSDDMKKAMSNINMEFLFEKATPSYKNKDDDMFVISAEYDNTIGYVKMVRKSKNPNFTGDVPTDVTYKYEVKEFKAID